MMNELDNTEFGFFITEMPDSRPADIYLGCLDGSVYIDFDFMDNGCLCLKRISFDGYGCYGMDSKATPLSVERTTRFMDFYRSSAVNNVDFANIVVGTIIDNKKLISEEVLKEYKLT